MAEPTAKTQLPDQETRLPKDEWERSIRAADLIQDWMADESGYDQEVWPLLAEELSNLRTRIGG